MIEIWGKENCPQCEAVKKICETRNLNYVYKQLEKDFTRDEVLAEFPGARTFPQIKVLGNVVGGQKQFEDYLDESN